MAGFKETAKNIIAKHSGIAGSLDVKSLYNELGGLIMENVSGRWNDERGSRGHKKAACYLSAEFLIGRMIYSNLFNLELLEDFRQAFWDNKLDPNMLEQIEDAALGNGGLGRLAACFLDSAASVSKPVDGYGIRYKYGLFKQYFDKGFQNETADDWLSCGDPFSVRRESEKVRVNFKDQSVWAVPYDMPVIGYKGTVNNLRLWQAEALYEFDFDKFNSGDYTEAFRSELDASKINAVLYPNDDTYEGKRLRLKQQYFFAAASIRSVINTYKAVHGADTDRTVWNNFPNFYAVQLNDTHPTVAIPEFLRILQDEEMLDLDTAFDITTRVFSYTNHTIMAEALEKWDTDLFCSVIPEVYPYVVMLNNHMRRHLTERKVSAVRQKEMFIIDKEGKNVHMAKMAIYSTHSTNGVAWLHTELLKKDVLKDWYELYPDRFNNKTNGITQRRWLGLCNEKLSTLINSKIGSGWLSDLSQLKRLEDFANDGGFLNRLNEIKRENKERLMWHVKMFEYGYTLNIDTVFDVQVKRLHEYKRQLLNAFSIVDIYFSLKEGSLTDLPPVTFIFGAKAAPGYRRAKAVIKYINEIAKIVNDDPDTKDRLQVLFVQNYNVSYAEKIIPASDVSEQISTAGTEASGTSNMKFMLNGAVTLGTYDGANIEIVQRAGEQNNYIFGKRVEEIESAKAAGYYSYAIYNENPRIRRVVDTLNGGAFPDGQVISDESGDMLKELYTSLLEGASWHEPDHYFLLLDFEDYVDTKIRVYNDYKNREDFARKCLYNIANAGDFSSDRTIRAYCDEIWAI